MSRGSETKVRRRLGGLLSLGTGRLIGSDEMEWNRIEWVKMLVVFRVWEQRRIFWKDGG